MILHENGYGIRAPEVGGAGRDLQADGCVTTQAETAKRGPGKTVYDLTAKGKEAFEQLVAEALSSPTSVYSDRIAGMVLALFLSKSRARPKIVSCIANLKERLVIIKKEKKQHSSTSAQIVLDYYHDIYAAELRAMRRTQDSILND